MKNTTVAFLAAGAAVLLASCATAPRTPSLTIELFDSRAARAAAQGTPVPPPELLLPAIPEVAAVPAAVRPADLPVRSAPPAPAAAAESSVARLSFDAGLTAPVRPRVKTSFALAAPSVPAAATSAAAAPRPSAPSAPRAASQNSAPNAPVSTVPSPIAQPAQAPAAMGGTAASSSSTTSTSTTPATGAPAAPYGRLREIYARQDDVLQVGLDGVGFLFLGFPDSMGQADGMAFKSKENRNNKTWFTFQALKIGTYDLDFLQQDNTAGRTAKETVRVHVVSDQDFNAAVAQQPGPDPDAPGTEETGDPVFARKLSTLGSYQAAVVELLKGYKDGNPPLNDQIAGLYMRMGSYEAAGKYYGKNLSPQNAFTSSAVTGLVRIAVFQNDQQGLLSYLKQFLALKDPSMEEPLVQCVRMEKARSEIGMALDLAGEYLKRFPDGVWRDEADYLTAQLLEADSQFRDLARARDLYSGILTSHPESAFADSARQRLQYIDRHFIQVR